LIKKLFKRLSIIVGFTESELKIVFFLLFTFATGIVLKYCAGVKIIPAAEKYDYSYSDSLIFGSPNKGKLKSEEKKVESEQELSDFSTNNIESNYKKFAKSLSGKININKADEIKLSQLPGIGKKTAGNIVNYRRNNGGFKKIEDLMKVKGIGKRKFNKIKKLIHL